jgi:uncharacterized protein (DUF58 family)
MYSKRWLYIIIAVLILGAILREGALVTIGALAGMALGSAWLWNRYVLRDVQYERVFSQTRVFPGEKVDVSIRATNHKLLPLPWLDISDEFPTRLPLTKGRLDISSESTVGVLSHLVALRWYERVSWRHQINAVARGYYPFGPLTLKSGDMFGIFTSEERREEQSFLTVYPRVVPLERLGLPSRQPFGEMRSPQRIFEDPIRTMGIRDYQRGDGFKRIHWKATARRQALQSRVYEPTATPQLAIFLNVSTFEHFWQGVDTSVLEGAITVAASLAQYALDEGYAAGLFVNAPLVQSDQSIRVPTSRSPQQMTIILESLAKLNVFALETIEESIERQMPRLPWGATLIVVTAVVTPALAATLARLRETGRQTVLVTFGDTASGDDLPGVLAYSIRAEPLLSA